MRYLQLARDIRTNVKNEHDRISSALIYRLGPGMREAAYLFRRKKELEHPKNIRYPDCPVSFLAERSHGMYAPLEEHVPWS